MSKFAALILALIAVILVMPVHPVHAENPIEETTDNIIVSINRMFDRPPVVSVSPRVKEYRVGQGEAQSGEELDEYVVVDIYARDDTEVKGVVAGFGASNQALDQLDWSLKNLGILKDQLAEISCVESALAGSGACIGADDIEIPRVEEIKLGGIQRIYEVEPGHFVAEQNLMSFTTFSDITAFFIHVKAWDRIEDDPIYTTVIVPVLSGTKVSPATLIRPGPPASTVCSPRPEFEWTVGTPTDEMKLVVNDGAIPANPSNSKVKYEWTAFENWPDGKRFEWSIKEDLQEGYNCWAVIACGTEQEEEDFYAPEVRACRTSEQLCFRVDDQLEGPDCYDFPEDELPQAHAWIEKSGKGKDTVTVPLKEVSGDYDKNRPLRWVAEEEFLWKGPCSTYALDEWEWDFNLKTVCSPLHPGRHFVYLTAFYDGAYHRISNTVVFDVEGAKPKRPQIEVSPRQGKAGTAFMFYVTGLNPRSGTSLDIRDPDGERHTLNERLPVDDNGIARRWCPSSMTQITGTHRVHVASTPPGGQMYPPTEHAHATFEVTTGTDGSEGKEIADKSDLRVWLTSGGEVGNVFAFTVTGLDSGDTARVTLVSPDSTRKVLYTDLTSYGTTGRATFSIVTSKDMKSGVYTVIVRSAHEHAETTFSLSSDKDKPGVSGRGGTGISDTEEPETSEKGTPPGSSGAKGDPGTDESETSEKGTPPGSSEAENVHDQTPPKTSEPTLPGEGLVQVPNVVGLVTNEASWVIGKLGFPMTIRGGTAICGSVIPHYHIYMQDPAGGEWRDPQSTRVELRQVMRGYCVPRPASNSQGPAVSIPDVVGMMPSDAERALNEAGFAVDLSLDSGCSDEVPDGRVFKQWPKAGTREDTARAVVEIYSSRGGCDSDWEGQPPPPSETKQNPPAITFWASALELFDGECTTLLWNVEGASEVFVQGQRVLQHGQREFCPLLDTLYVLRAVGDDGQESRKSVAVDVKHRPGTVRVPNVIGMTLHVGDDALVAAGFDTFWGRDGCSDEVRPGLIYSQEPAGGRWVDPKNHVVEIRRSSGPCQPPEKEVPPSPTPTATAPLQPPSPPPSTEQPEDEYINVPGVIGLMPQNAKSVLNAAGFVVLPGLGGCSDTVAPGFVFHQAPSAGTSVRKGVPVTIRTAIGPCDSAPEDSEPTPTPEETVDIPPIDEAEPTPTPEEPVDVPPVDEEEPTPTPEETVDVLPIDEEEPTPTPEEPREELMPVPSVIGMTPEDAENVLSDAGFGMTYGDDGFSDDIGPGLVFQQEPAAGEMRDPSDTTVRVRISLGPEPREEPVPDVVGLTPEDAENTLRGAGFDVAYGDEGFSNDTGPGLVFQQEPAAGEMRDPASTTVTVRISLGPETRYGWVIGAVTRTAPDISPGWLELYLVRAGDVPPNLCDLPDGIEFLLWNDRYLSVEVPEGTPAEQPHPFEIDSVEAGVEYRLFWLDSGTVPGCLPASEPFVVQPNETLDLGVLVFAPQ